MGSMGVAWVQAAIGRRGNVQQRLGASLRVPGAHAGVGVLLATWLVCKVAVTCLQVAWEKRNARGWSNLA